MRLLTLRFISLLIGSLLLMTYSVFSAATKPMRDGMFLGNAFPSGPHYNLIIHGKDRDTFTCPGGDGKKDVVLLIDNGEGIAEIYSDTIASCIAFVGISPEDDSCLATRIYGNSIFVPRTEVGDEIQIILESGSKGRKKQGTNYVLMALEAKDWCTEPFDSDAAVVSFPPDPKGYAVYGRVLGKPFKEGTASGGEPSFTFTAEGLIQVTDESGNNSLLFLGLVSSDGVFVPGSFTDDTITLYRWEGTGSGKGARKATDLTGMFTFSGEICYLAGSSSCGDGCGPGEPLCCIDGDGDGFIANDIYDQCIGSTNLLGDYTTWYETSSDAVASFEEGKDAFCADPSEFTYTSTTSAPGPSYSWIDTECKTYEDAWVFNIADFVDMLWGGDTTGAYNVQVRFYPISENPQLDPEL